MPRLRQGSFGVIGAGSYFETDFARAVNGEQIIRATDKSLAIEFDCPEIGAVPGGRTLTEFKLKALTIQGTPIC